jgi:dTDP-4-dehydrorhamnose 3,5-epimerase
MQFSETGIAGAWLIDVEPVEDERGMFARTWCEGEARERGIAGGFLQQSVSWNRRRGTLRGLHFQASPMLEEKLVRCTAGRIHDVIVDLRRESPSYLRCFSVELSAENRRALYIPGAVAHGFQTLEDASEVFYEMNAPYHAQYSIGVRWNDEDLGIDWPLPNPILSDRDRGLPLLRELEAPAT